MPFVIVALDRREVDSGFTSRDRCRACFSMLLGLCLLIGCGESAVPAKMTRDMQAVNVYLQDTVQGSDEWPTPESIEPLVALLERYDLELVGLYPENGFSTQEPVFSVKTKGGKIIAVLGDSAVVQLSRPEDEPQ